MPCPKITKGIPGMFCVSGPNIAHSGVAETSLIGNLLDRRLDLDAALVLEGNG